MDPNIDDAKQSKRLVFRSRAGSPVGDLVKTLARASGFEWKPLPAYPLSPDAAVVLIAPAGEESTFEALRVKCGVFNDVTMTACACYELRIGATNSSTEDIGESLIDWMFTERYFYGQKEFCFEYPDVFLESDLDLLKSMLAENMRELANCEMKIREKDRFVMRPLDVELYEACAKGSSETVRKLLDRGADPNAPHWEKPWPTDLEPEIYTEDYYCVHQAAVNPDIRILNLLVERGADPNRREYWGRQPLAYAGRSGTLEMVRRLVELGNDPGNNDEDGGTVLSWSALNPDERVLELLLECGAEIGDTCVGGTELDIALREGTPERVRFFVEHGGEMKNLSSDSFIKAPLGNIRTLLECGLNPNYKDEYGERRLVDILDPARRALFLEFGANS